MSDVSRHGRMHSTLQLDTKDISIQLFALEASGVLIIQPLTIRLSKSLTYSLWDGNVLASCKSDWS